MKKNEIEKLESKCGIDTFSVRCKNEPALIDSTADYAPEYTCKVNKQDKHSFYAHLDDISDDANDNSIAAATAIANCIAEMNCVKAIVTRVDFRTDFYDCDFENLENLNYMLNGLLSMILKGKNVKTTHDDSDGSITGFYFEKDGFGTNIYDKAKQQKTKKERNKRTPIYKRIKTRVELRIKNRKFKPNEKYLVKCVLEICELLAMTTTKKTFNHFVNVSTEKIWKRYNEESVRKKKGKLSNCSRRMAVIGRCSDIICCREIASAFLRKCGVKDIKKELYNLRSLNYFPDECRADYIEYVKHIINGYIRYIAEELKEGGLLAYYYERLKKVVKPLDIRLEDYF